MLIFKRENAETEPLRNIRMEVNWKATTIHSQYAMNSEQNKVYIYHVRMQRDDRSWVCFRQLQRQRKTEIWILPFRSLTK